MKTAIHIHACQVKFAVEVLGHLSVAELQARLAQIEAQGKDTAARIAAGETGRVIGQHMVRGKWQDTDSLQSALNVQRGAWAQTKAALRVKLGQL